MIYEIQDLLGERHQNARPSGENFPYILNLLQIPEKPLQLHLCLNFCCLHTEAAMKHMFSLSM